MGVRPFSEATRDRTRVNGLKLCQGVLMLNFRENFLSGTVANHGNNLPTQCSGGVPILEGFKSHVDVAPGDMV